MSKWQKKGLKGLGKFGGDIAGDLAGGVVGDQLARVGLNEEVAGYISDEVGDFAEDMTEDAIRGKGKFKRGGHSSSPPPPYSDSRGMGGYPQGPHGSTPPPYAAPTAPAPPYREPQASGTNRSPSGGVSDDKGAKKERSMAIFSIVGFAIILLGAFVLDLKMFIDGPDALKAVTFIGNFFKDIGILGSAVFLMLGAISARDSWIKCAMVLASVLLIIAI